MPTRSSRHAPRREFALALLVALLLVNPTAAAVPVPPGYRTDRYHAPVPDRVPGGTVLDTPGMAALIDRERPVLIDTAPLSRTGESDFEGRWIVSPARRDIPGSLWLPNVGYGVLEPEMQDYLRLNLERATAGDRGRAVVFYCEAECWMAWNAARRAALEFGYTRVYWYPMGTDGWRAAGHELAPVEPVPLPGWE